MDASDLLLVSGDSHVTEPRALWWDGLPEGLREKAPARIRPTQDGAWALSKHEETTVTQAQKDRMEEHLRNEANDLGYRLSIMREDGIAAECVYPTIGLYIWDMDDFALGEACCEIYNDWIYSTLQAKSNRHSCAGIIPTWNMDNAIAEVRRIAAMGLGSIMIPLHGVPEEYNSKYWEPLWDAIEETSLPVVMHQGSGHDMLFYRGPGAAVANLLATQSMAPRTAALLATSGTLERHPGLHFVFVETNAAWMSWSMDTLDSYYTAFTENPGWVKPLLKELPSYYMARQLHATFQWDPTGVNNLVRTGVEPLIWGSDYPHSEGTYPHSRKVVGELLADLTLEQATAIAGGTAIELFHFDREVLNSPIPGS